MLQRAAERLGGLEELARYLGVTELRVQIWLRGRIAPCDAIFLKLVDLLNEEPPPNRLYSRDPKRRGVP